MAATSGPRLALQLAGAAGRARELWHLDRHGASAHPAGGDAPALAALPALSRAWWVAGHLVVSLGAVPIAEELAFRGYLLRRIAAADFESLLPRSIGTWPLLFSSLVSGCVTARSGSRDDRRCDLRACIHSLAADG